MQTKFKIYGGRYFPNILIYVSCGFLIIGLFAATETIVGGLVIMGISSFFIFTPDGVQIDPAKKMYRNYVNLIGIDRGEWKSLQDYPYITILSKNITQTVNVGFVLSNSFTERLHDICLLNKTHQQKIIIKRVDKIELAKNDIASLSEKMGLTIVNYNPPISVETKAKRYRHK